MSNSGVHAVDNQQAGTFDYQASIKESALGVSGRNSITGLVADDHMRSGCIGPCRFTDGGYGGRRKRTDSPFVDVGACLGGRLAGRNPWVG